MNRKLSPKLQLLLVGIVLVIATAFAIWRDYTFNTQSEASALETIKGAIGKVKPIGGAVLVDQPTLLS